MDTHIDVHKVKQKALTRIILVVALFFVCLSVVMRLSRDVYREYHKGSLRPEYRHRQALTNGTFSASIEPWMTFDYINTIFHIPSVYLKQALNISDDHYPNMQIARYAKEKGMDTNEVVRTITNAIMTYSQGKGVQ